MNTHLMSQDEINKQYAQLEIEAHRLEGRYFNIRKSAWTNEGQEIRYNFIRKVMQYLAKYHNAHSLPF